MRCVRFEEQGRARIGFIDGDVIRAVYGSIDTYWRMTDEVFPLAGTKLLAPCVPKQIICVGFNYRDHAREFHVDVPKEPALFTKAAHTVIGNDGKIIYPRQSHEVVYEAELGVVIKKRMKDVAPEDVPDYILALMMLQHGICSCRTYSGCAVNLLILFAHWGPGWKLILILQICRSNCI